MGEKSSEVKVKLTVDKATNRVLFAEAGKDFVDFIFHIHELPVGVVSRLVRSVSDEPPNCVHNIENSIRNLQDRYMISNQKAMLLDPPVRNCGLRFKVSSNPPRIQTVYACATKSRLCRAVIDNPHADYCYHCWEKRKIIATVEELSNEEVVAKHDGEGGYVKGLATYMVTDDLVVKPRMLDSCYDVVKEFKVKSLEDVEEKIVDVSLNETVLTDTFLPKKPRKSPAHQQFSEPIMFSGGSISYGSTS